MKRKIIGATVGTPLPKPDMRQTDPKKGDYVKGKEEYALKSEIPSSVQPDWNQNDPSAPDYVKNKPFGDVEKVGVTILNECETPVSPNMNGFQYGGVKVDSLELGTEYVVIFDGVTYNCVGMDVNGRIVIGNPYLYSKGTHSDNNMPFVLYFYFDDDSTFENMACIYPEDSTVSHTVEVKQVVEKVTTLDRKYLPEPDMVITVNSHPNVKITNAMISISSGSPENVGKRVREGEVPNVVVKFYDNSVDPDEYIPTTYGEYRATVFWYAGDMIFYIACPDGDKIITHSFEWYDGKLKAHGSRIVSSTAM